MNTSSGSVVQQGLGARRSKRSIVAVGLVLVLAATFAAGASLGRASAPKGDRVQVESIDLSEIDLRGPAAALHRRIYEHFPELVEAARP